MADVETQGAPRQRRRADQGRIRIAPADRLRVDGGSESHVLGPTGEIGIVILAQPGVATAREQRICFGQRQHALWVPRRGGGCLRPSLDGWPLLRSPACQTCWPGPTSPSTVTAFPAPPPSR